MARVVVVGAGVGGLCAALRLSVAGHDVTVCEAAERVGGKLGRWSDAGFTFDTGPSLLTMPHVFAELFSDVGERLDDQLELQRLNPITRCRWVDGTQVDTSSDRAAMGQQFTAAFGEEAARDWTRLMTRAAAIWRAVEDPVLRTPSAGWRSFAPLLRRVGDLIRVAPHMTLRQAGWRYLREPRQRMLLDRYATYTGSDPRRAPAALLTVPYVEQTFGGWYVAGGLYRLAEVLADLAGARGARLRVATPVARVLTAAAKVRGVETAAGEFLPADVVVANVDASVLAGMVEPRWPVVRAPASSSGFVVLLGVEGTTPGLASHNVWFPRDYDAEFEALFGQDPRPVDDPTIYVSRPDDATSAPPGCEAWFVLVNAPRHTPARGGVDWDAGSVAGAYRDRILALLAERGLDVRRRIVVQRTLSPADLERSTGAPGGAIYGSSSNGPAAAFLRPPNTSAVSGLYLVGGSAHPGGGLPLVALSAAMVADLVGPA